MTKAAPKPQMLLAMLQRDHCRFSFFYINTIRKDASINCPQKEPSMLLFAQMMCRHCYIHQNNRIGYINFI